MPLPEPKKPVKFEHVVKVYDRDNEWLGELVANDTNAITGEPMAWCFRPVDSGLLSQEELESIADKLEKLNAEECPVKEDSGSEG